MKKITRKILSFVLVLVITLNVAPVIETKAAVVKNNITVFVNDTWSITMSNSNNYLGTSTGTKKGNKYEKDSATATISSKTLKVKGTAAGKNVFYIYNSKGNLCRQVTVTVKVVPSLNSVTNKYQNSGNTKSTNIYLYAGQSSTATMNVSGNVDSCKWTTNNTSALTITNTSSTTVTVKANKTGTYTLTGTISTSSNGTKGTVTKTKTIYVYVYNIPTIDVLSDGTSINSMTITRQSENLLSYRTTNVSTSVKCNVSFKVADNSKNYIKISSNKITALEGFPMNTTAYFVATLTISSGDNVSNNNGTQTFTKTIPVTLGEVSAENSDVYLAKGNGNKIDDVINLYQTPKFLDFNPVDTGGSNATFTFSFSDDTVAAVSSISHIPNQPCKYRLVGNNIGTTELTVTAKRGSVIHSKVYTINVYSSTTSLSVDNMNVLKDTVTPITIKGVLPENYRNGKETELSLYKPMLRYASSNENVAYVNDDGKIIAKSSGTATISIKYIYVLDYMYATDPKNPSFVEQIKVTNPSTIFTVTVNELITDMMFENNTVEMLMGNTKTILPICYPLNAQVSKKFTWNTSNPTIATVDINGKVLAIKPGQARITATATDGSKEKATYTVRVKANNPVLKTISSTKTGIKITWNKASYAEKYNIHRSESKNGEYKRVGSTTLLNYTDAKADMGKTYYYKVTSVPDAGSSYESVLGNNYKSIKHTPKKPSVKSVKKKSGGYRIKIKGTKYDGFVIYVGKKKTTKKVAAIITGKTSTIFINKKGKYYVRVRAYKEVSGKKVYSKYSKAKKFKVK